MGTTSIRSLLVAAIVFINCISWTASKHHFSHSIHGHRIRHRRQGAGLFLPASYVIPGGKGGGAWTEWGEVSPCSRTCGGGVASQKRICLDFGPEGQPQCAGADTKYFSCQTQDCPEDSRDFRAVQCSEYDDVKFRGQRYNWVPYTKAPNPCELNCMPHGERFYYRQKVKVVDGTRCNDESFDVCVDGVCQPVGCDMMLGSNAREDKCRQCRGNGTNCFTAAGIIDTQDLRKGYNDVLLIPQGATNIVIAEVNSSSNYLALRAQKDNVYYLNGDYHIDFPRSIVIASSLWHYERSQQGFAAPDKLRSLGPTNESLYLSILLQEDNVGIEYEYSVPSALAPPPNQQYNWVHEEFTPCTATCGGGTQTRRVTCRSREELEEVDDSLCDGGLKPPTNQTCNTDACPPRWVDGPWSPCSKPCGEGGTRSRQVHCEKIIAQGIKSITADKECFDLLGPKPELYQECNQNATCPTWFAGPWRPCDKLCGPGKQIREVVCHQRVNGRVEVFGDEECSDEKPATTQPCMLHPCDGVDWVLSDWTGCDTCLSKVRTRVAQCATKDYQVVNSSFCSFHPMPVLQEPCDESLLPACQVQWYATQWSNCSVECGKGNKTRRVFCGLFDGVSVRAVGAERCDESARYRDTAPCEVPKEKCPAKWFAGPWSECTKKCGSGEQYRRVMCLKGEENSRDCDEESTLESTQACNTGPCDKDEMLPLDSKSTPIMDDGDYDEDCPAEEDEYSEEGLELKEKAMVTLFYEPMFSDAPEDGSGTTVAFSEIETEFTSETGSGSEPTSNTEIEVTEELGSGTTDTYEETDSTTEITGSTETSETNIDVSTVTDTTLEVSTETETETATSETETTTEIMSTVTAETGSTITSESEPTSEESATTETGSTETENTESTSSGITTESTETSVTEVSKTESDGTDSTESTVTEETVTTETTESGTTEGTESTSSGSTEPSATEHTATTETLSETDDTTATDSTETEGSTTESGSTESSTTESGSTESSTTESGSTESSTTESGSTESSTTESGSTESSTTESGLTESSTTESGSTTSSTSESGSTEISTTESGSTEVSITESGSTEVSTTEGSTTESGSTDISTTEGVETTEMSSSESGSTVTESGTTESSEGSTATIESSISTESTVSGSSEATETTSEGSTEMTSEGSTTEESSTEGTTNTEGTGSTESTSEGMSTTEVSTSDGSTMSESPGSTEPASEGSSTTEVSSEESTLAGGTSSWDWSSTVEVYTRRPKCRPRKKIAKCFESMFGCCPDNKSPAAGPFEEGCSHPESCQETEYGCCPDGVSPAQGFNNKGCPVVACTVTLYGCCKSDNITAAQGNDEDGCPPPPPACKSSKYGCCKDEKTAAKGRNKEGCPETEVRPAPAMPTAEGCGNSEFGCCYDNETDASGPNGEGCPCSISEFGCCPDGIATAQGANLEGCVMSCNTSAYGCCADGETPAHGPAQEGCCLQYAFGCCPDNHKPAEGPHMEGCGCEYAHFGCCPDNVTIARGPNNEGCGCKYTEHGCCPDRHTPALGPQFEGCGCHTYQFGCCPDGVTAATGPNLQGCLCQQAQYGCCGDDVTPARGPNGEGCDCSTSKYGCCPDGVTAAAGEKFFNCTDAPENKQAACALANDRGPCRNHSVQYYYDMTYGDCLRFWYGGCDGNGNRFASQADCEAVCVRPSPKDACNLPKVKGGCSGYFVRWYYDAAREQCSQFVFGGCLGNANNFESLELCQERCEPEKTEDQCNLEIERGPCAGNFLRWGYSGATRRCSQFVWGGCEGNSNRFGSEAACMQRCNPPGTPQALCSLPHDGGNCTEKHPAWSFSAPENRCVPFYYTGCGGNDNRFDNERACAQTCPSAYVQEICTLPALTGECADYTQRWFYDTTKKRCRQFYYGGCGGNENNFASEWECENRCAEQIVTTTVQPVAESHQSEFCFLELDSGPCTQLEPRWGYDAVRGACVPFQYGGCGGNRNNFPSQEYCQYYCSPAQDICQLPMMSGPCDDSQMRWFYDAASDSCSQFTYGGCEGNDNRFETREDCERRCRTGTAPVTVAASTTTVTPQQTIRSECEISATLEQCEAPGRVWYFAPGQGCVPHDNPAAGRACRVSAAWDSQEECERVCGAFQDLDVCRHQVDPGPCHEALPKVYYDAATDRCLNFTYGGCSGGPNRFSSVEECEGVCRPNADPCQQTPEPGNCLGNELMWYYDSFRDECSQFVYGGCNGNDNRFTTQAECEGRCRVTTTPAAMMTRTTRSTTTTTTTTMPVPTLVSRLGEECRTPSSLEPCGRNVTTWYYDERTQACVVGDMGACGLSNTHRSEEECERRCGAFHGLDVCNSRLDPGPCIYAIQKVYWDAVTGRCLSFAYGGCHGGPNRFSTFEECEEVCGETGPENNEVVPKADCTVYRSECAALRCEYGVQRMRTPDGCERCSCVAVEIDCAPLRQECDAIKCAYGVDRTEGTDGCTRCRCFDHPCADRRCPAGERCVASAYRDPLTQEVAYSAECRLANKTGACPADEQVGVADGQCRVECNDDADCLGVGKCCSRGCARLCLAPAVITSPAPAAVTSPAPRVTYVPELPQAPQADVQTEPEVRAAEGGTATLRCLFHGNPPPRITWRRGEITIDGDVGRYRLLSDGALEIVSLYRNDSGVYICVADNALGVATQQVYLEVDDPVDGPAGIEGAPNAVIIGEIGHSLNVRCLAFGYPKPTIYWYRGRNGPMVPYSSSLYEARENVLQIRKLNLETLGEYICQAYNGIGKPAEWAFVVQAYRPDGAGDFPYLITRPDEVLITAREPRTDATTTPLPEIEVPVYTVPVTTRITAEATRVSAGSAVNLPCEVDGYPVPDVTWTKDAVPLVASERVQITEARLTIYRANTNDSGLYGCEAANAYSSHSSTVQITVEGLYIPPSCKDNPYFAKCNLIVQSNFCQHRYYSKFCCKSCVEAGQLDPLKMELQADEPYTRK